MSNDEFTFRPQDVDFLGFLEAQLRDLQGIETVAYELIQNADDVRDEVGTPQSSWISFDVTDDALIVANDGVFRPVDFSRLQRIAGGGKREEAGTTGAFGIGFVAVYQVTDRPIVRSGNREWTIRPEEPADRRIVERPAETDGTRFILPWATDPASVVRRTLRLETIPPASLDRLAAAIARACDTAALFLKQLRVLEVRRRGTPVRRIEREVDERGTLLLRDETGAQTKWQLLEGDFGAEAEQLREQFPWQIEAGRRTTVRLALPEEPMGRPGRLYADLPSATTTPLPLHVNADFFPTTDRKRIHFDDGYQAAWNAAAVDAAAKTVAEHLRELPGALGPKAFWQLLEKLDETGRQAQRGDLPTCFAAFWEEVAPLLRKSAIVYSSDQQWRRPDQVRLPLGRSAQGSIDLLHALPLSLVHPDLFFHADLLQRPEIGVAPLDIYDLSEALRRLGFSGIRPLHEAPADLKRVEAWRGLWHIVDGLLNQVTDRDAAREALDAIGSRAVVLTDDMTLAPLDHVFRGRAETRALFPDVKWLHEQVPERGFPGEFVSTFGARQAVERLAATLPAELEQRWRLGRLDLPRLFRWFESHQIEILSEDPLLREKILDLPLSPVEGELRPLAELYIPGGFEDPLRLTGVVDLEAVGGRRQFLRDLGMRTLDFDAYVRREVPRVFDRHPDLPSDARQELVRLLAARLGAFRDDRELQETLARLPLVACLDGAFRPAGEVYASRQVLVYLGQEAHVAEPAGSDAVTALHHWLGVHDQPPGAALIRHLRHVGEKIATARDARHVDPETAASVARCWTRLAKLLDDGAIASDDLASLRKLPAAVNMAGDPIPPTRLLLNDRQDLADNFPALFDLLLPENHPAAPALAAAGARLLTEAVTTRLQTPEDATPLPEVTRRIRDRVSLLERVCRAEPALTSTAWLDRLQVFSAAQIHLRPELIQDEQVLRGPVKAVPLHLRIEPPELYIVNTPTIPWGAVARAIAQILKGGGPVGSLAIGLREVLRAPTPEEANATLDDLGYPA